MKTTIILIAGFIMGAAMTANAGIISHVAAYEIGKSNGKSEAHIECKCPEVK